VKDFRIGSDVRLLEFVVATLKRLFVIFQMLDEWLQEESSLSVYFVQAQFCGFHRTRHAVPTVTWHGQNIVVHQNAKFCQE
jgi:hypothetical protein